jgi:2-methylcitrate dehydratase
MNKRSITDYANELVYEDLPVPVVHEVKRRAIDSFGRALAAWSTPPGTLARRAAAEFVTITGGAQLWGTRQRVATDWAAFANSSLVGDGDFIPALFSVADAENAGGRELITAIALAGGNVTQTVCAIALAAAKLMKLETASLAQAVGIASVAEAGPFAAAARRGVFAALLARNGFTGPAASFEADQTLANWKSSPLSDAEVEEKFLKIANRHLTRDQVEKIIHRLWRLDETHDVAEIVSLLEIVA